MYILARKNIFLIYLLIVILSLIAVNFQVTALDFIVKPLMMPCLIAAVLLLTKETRGRIKILAALFFSTLGDVFLMLESKSNIFFIAGLVSFLITHVFYISYFTQIKRAGSSLAKKHFYLPILLVFYTLSLLYILMPHLDHLKIPVIIYAIVISVMLYTTLALPYTVNRTVRQLLIAGAVFFVISDSLLALNKFYKAFPYAALLIRLSYCIAQYFIVRGFIRKRY